MSDYCDMSDCNTNHRHKHEHGCPDGPMHARREPDAAESPLLVRARGASSDEILGSTKEPLAAIADGFASSPPHPAPADQDCRGGRHDNE